ncbi:GDYXXLXY domain-containing protein [Thorsellia anophelis]|uniref:Uncharacterized membrane protein n=1 Tax=Thorsellia anophelis DSM 18579 TaxID=1123402 RepID=A0A1H9Y2J1_9GAMM|nr:GDYXXLXY domain-containing protein [Thorsellia anophelis]SES62871.1 Uncharacterized membrane protein [Thorsellia anophelis DSM 18579]
MQTQQHNLQVSKYITVNLIILSIILLSSGLITFVAANWSEIDIMQRFMITQGTLIASAIGCIGLTLYFKPQISHEHLGAFWGNFCLTLIAITAIGGIFALIGQTYQTGADAWQLFALWTALALPWALYQNKPLIWLFWLVILNTTLLLISNQLFNAFFPKMLLPAIINLLIYIAVVRTQKINWLSHLLLVTTLTYSYLFIFFESNYDNIIIVLIASTVLLLIALEIYLRKEPISYIIIIFYILVFINTLIHSNIQTDFTFQFLFITISLIISTVLFFSYLRSVYLKWRKENAVFSDDTQLKMRRTLTICRSLLGWSISIAASAFILLWLDDQLIIVIPFILGALILIKNKVLSDSLVNQISCAFIYVFCALSWGEIVTREFITPLFETAVIDRFFWALLVTAICITMLFILVKNTASRSISAVALTLITINMFLLILKKLINATDYELIQIYLYYIVVISNYLLIALIIYSDKRPKAKLFRVKPFSLIPTQVWWVLLMLIGVYHIFLLSEFFSKKYVHEYANFFYIPMPLFTAALLWLNNKLPNDTRFKIGLLILSAASYFILPYFSGLNYILTLIFISVALQSRTVLVLSWMFSLLLLTFNYYSKEVLLIDKSFQLAVSGGVIFLFSMLLSFFVKQIEKDLKSISSEKQNLDTSTRHSDDLTTEGNDPNEITPKEKITLSALLATRKTRLSLATIGLGAALFIANTTIIAYEHIIKEGDIVRLDLTPADPRSLIQGDYMRLAYRLESSIASELYQQKLKDSQFEKSLLFKIFPEHYSLSYTLDENRVMQWAGIHNEEEYASIGVKIDEFNDATIRISHEYFFEDGQAEQYEKAKYAEFRRGPNGKLILSNLLDEKFKIITNDQSKE